MRHQLLARGHVNAIHVGKAHGRRGAGQENLAGPGVAHHLHDFAAGGAANDGVIDQQHVLARELAGDGAELLPHRFFAHGLPRHDERAAHVAVFHKAFPARQPQQLRQPRGAGAAGFGHGNDHVNLRGRHGGNHAPGQRLAQRNAGLIDGDAIHHRIGPGQIHVFKDAGRAARLLSALHGAALAAGANEHGLARLQIALQRAAQPFQRHGFAGHHRQPVGAAAHAQRADAVRIAKGQQAMPRNHGNHGIRAAHALVHAAHGGEHILLRERVPARNALQLMRQHAQQHLGIAAGVGVAVIGGKQLGLERRRVGEIAVVHQHDAKRRARIERLRLFFAVGVARRGVAHLAQPHVAGQRAHVAGAKHIAHHAARLVHEKAALVLGGDARRVLPPVLQQQKRVIKNLIDRGAMDCASNAAHGGWLQ